MMRRDSSWQRGYHLVKSSPAQIRSEYFSFVLYHSYIAWRFNDILIVPLGRDRTGVLLASKYLEYFIVQGGHSDSYIQRILCCTVLYK